MTRKRIPQLQLPNFTGIASTIINATILFVTIEHDSDSENPTSWDGFGIIRSLSHRHVNSITLNELLNESNTDPDAVLLSYEEHGMCRWSVKPDQSHLKAPFEWDRVDLAGIWIPDKCVRESYMGQDGLTRREWMLKQAASACGTYTDWCNGQVFGYEASFYFTRYDDSKQPITDLDYYRHHAPISEDSCWGFYGYESVKEEAISAVKSILKEQKFSRRAIDAAIKEAA